jgi:hypothetical protein
LLQPRLDPSARNHQQQIKTSGAALAKRHQLQRKAARLGMHTNTFINQYNAKKKPVSVIEKIG